MREICVEASRAYRVQVGSGLLARAGEAIALAHSPCRAAIVSDSNVWPIYGEKLVNSLKSAGFNPVFFVFPAGEASKTGETYLTLLNFLAENRLTRADLLVALGGGVVGDVCGFAAATYLRGVEYVQLATTVLAAVDSSVGGKTAIDLPAGKNLVGAFWQPKLVLMDTSPLDTLSARIFSDGMAEVIKYGCIWDREFFDLLARCGDRAGVMEHIVEVLCTCCAIKAKVVMEDERDTGLRMILNFGHTLGHAYEKAYHYETYTHGQAVSAGMVLAAELGERLGVTQPGTKAQIEQLTAAFGLPTAIPCTAEDYESAVGLDKKGSGDSITVILLRTLGECAPTKMEKKELLALL